MPSPRPPIHRRATLLGIAFLLGVVGLGALGIHGRAFRPPYPEFGRRLAWWVGAPEAAYNFAEVVPGALYRSGLPDLAMLERARERHGVRRVLSLVGEHPVHLEARARGFEVEVADWPGERFATDLELRAWLGRVAEEGAGPLLVHCRHGMDRAGSVIALSRVLHEGWSVDDALREMERFGHDPARWPHYGAGVRSFLAAEPGA